MAEAAGDASVLRAKYLDWCSAQIADRFLRLPPDEIYTLAHDVSRDDTGRIDRDALSVLSMLGIAIDLPVEEPVGSGGRTATGGRAGAPGHPEGAAERPQEATGRDSYRSLVAQVAERLAVRMDLPDFEAWSAAYRADPERYDRQMLGFWRDSEEADDANRAG